MARGGGAAKVVGERGGVADRCLGEVGDVSEKSGLFDNSGRVNVCGEVKAAFVCRGIFLTFRSWLSQGILGGFVYGRLLRGGVSEGSSFERGGLSRRAPTGAVGGGGGGAMTGR